LYCQELFTLELHSLSVPPKPFQVFYLSLNPRRQFLLCCDVFERKTIKTYNSVIEYFRDCSDIITQMSFIRIFFCVKWAELKQIVNWYAFYQIAIRFSLPYHVLINLIHFVSGRRVVPSIAFTRHSTSKTFRIAIIKIKWSFITASTCNVVIC